MSKEEEDKRARDKKTRAINKELEVIDRCAKCDREELYNDLKKGIKYSFCIDCWIELCNIESKYIIGVLRK